ncbi:MAG: adenine methyltransferase, partial [Chloroflexota bacterium]|nr:adenine methyltransferase [Chloroflexota bacterium]
ALMVCLDQTISEGEIEELGLQLCAWKDELGYVGEVTSVFRDSAFVNDVAKVNLTTLLRENGVPSVRSI